MDQKRFVSGKTFTEYLESMDSVTRDGFVAAYEAASLDAAQIDAADSLAKKVHILAVSEHWCGDCRINVPVAARLAEQSPEITLRCHTKEEADGLQVEKIPTFIFYDAGFFEIGRWVERPHSVGTGLSTEDRDKKRDIRKRYNAGEFHKEAFYEMLDILRQPKRTERG